MEQQTNQQIINNGVNHINCNGQDCKSSFLKSVNGAIDTDSEKTIPHEKDHFLNVIENEINTFDVITKLSSATQTKIKVREIVLDSRLDFIASSKKLQQVFNDEFSTMSDKLNEKFNNELLILKQLYRKSLIGEGLIELVNAVSNKGWCLVMKEGSVNLYQCFNPAIPVTEGFYEDGTVNTYQSPVTSLRGIYINILHPKITTGTINLATEGGRHPNCANYGFGVACAGTLLDREIPVSDKGALITLLDEVVNTYERMHLDSAYYIPTIKYITKKEKVTQWTTE